MKLKALDTLHVSSVKPENIAPGEEFEMSDKESAESLVKRGLAVKVRAEKAEKPPTNKAAHAAKNKAG